MIGESSELVLRVLVKMKPLCEYGKDFITFRTHLRLIRYFNLYKPITYVQLKYTLHSKIQVFQVF